MTILIVEDRRDWQRIYEDILVDIGYSYEIVDSGARAIRKLSQKPFKLAIVDMRLTDWDDKNFEGMDVINWLLENAADTKVIAMTAYGTPEIVRECFKSGVVVDFFFKASFSPSELLDCIIRIMQSDSRS
jgi:two-component system sensor histidine kinase TorS